MPASSLKTEAWDKALFDLDLREPEAAARALLEAHVHAATVAYDAREQVFAVARRAAGGIHHGGRVFLLGAGTSGRLSKAAAGQFPEEVGYGILAGDGLEPTARREAEDDWDAGARDVLAVPGGLGVLDTVVGVSASGGARYVQGALRAARETGAYTVAVANNPGTPIAEFGDSLVLDTGAEPIKGSTRMKAGTAQKIVLDTLAEVLTKGHQTGLWLPRNAMHSRVTDRLEAHLAATMAVDSGEVASAAQEIPAKLAAGGRMLFLGAGFAGELAIQEAAELPPTFGVAEEKSVGFAVPFSGYEPGPNDVAMTLLGTTADLALVQSMERARRRGALTIGLASSSRLLQRERFAHSISLAGLGEGYHDDPARATGMKAALNSATTLAMVYDNRTYGNLMTNVEPANEKLRKRMVTIASEAAGVSETEAAAVLRASDHELPTAIVALKGKIEPAAARQRLTEHGNSIRSALGERRGR